MDNLIEIGTLILILALAVSNYQLWMYYKKQDVEALLLENKELLDNVQTLLNETQKHRTKCEQLLNQTNEIITKDKIRRGNR